MSLSIYIVQLVTLANQADVVLIKLRLLDDNAMLCYLVPTQVPH